MADEETPVEDPADETAAPPTIFVLGEGGYVFELSLPLHETIEDKLRKGHIRRVQPDGSPYTVDDQPDSVPALPDKRPNVNAPKAEWIGWAVKNGATVQDAESATKPDLIEKYGASSDAAPSGEVDTRTEQEKAAAEQAAADAQVDPATAGGLEGAPGDVIHNENREDGAGNADEPHE